MSKEPPPPPPHEEWDFSRENLPDEDVFVCFLHEYNREHPEGPVFPITWPFKQLTDKRFGLPFLSLSRAEREELTDYLTAKLPLIGSGFIFNLMRILERRLNADERRLFGTFLTGAEVDHILLGQIMRKELTPGEADEPVLVCLNRQPDSHEQMMKGFGDWIRSLPGYRPCNESELISADHHLEERYSRGPKPDYRTALTNLAIVRIRHRLPLRQAVDLYRRSYLNNEFSDTGGHLLKESQAGLEKDAIENRINERRREFQKKFRELHFDLEKAKKPISSRRYKE